jgi:ADP-heptose:LPS heptosyltransferase
MKILVIRRDNIGDLVCTTPLIHALREHYPTATITALVNSYNAPVLANNPDVDAVFAYTKAKHRPSGTTYAKVYWNRLRLFAQLRKMHFDYAILAAPRFQPRLLRLARLVGARHIIGFTEPDARGSEHIDIGVPYGPTRPPLHEVEDVFRLLAPLEISAPPPSVLVRPDKFEVESARNTLRQAVPYQPELLVGVHISARKPSQRWPIPNFVGIMKRLHQENGAAFMLFWSPGDSGNPLHPGDDAKAREILEALQGIPVLPYATRNLGQLIAGLSLCDIVVCSDGGAMHIAAGLGKPILCFFGKSDVTRWHPWGVPHVTLQPETREASDISVESALQAFCKLAPPAQA